MGEERLLTITATDDDLKQVLRLAFAGAKYSKAVRDTRRKAKEACRRVASEVESARNNSSDPPIPLPSPSPPETCPSCGLKPRRELRDSCSDPYHATHGSPPEGEKLCPECGGDKDDPGPIVPVIGKDGGLDDYDHLCDNEFHGTPTCDTCGVRLPEMCRCQPTVHYHTPPSCCPDEFHRVHSNTPTEGESDA